MLMLFCMLTWASSESQVTKCGIKPPMPRDSATSMEMALTVKVNGLWVVLVNWTLIGMVSAVSSSLTE